MQDFLFHSECRHKARTWCPAPAKPNVKNEYVENYFFKQFSKYDPISDLMQV